MSFKDRVKWYGVVSGCAFLGISTYIKYVKVAFPYAEEASFYMRLAELAALSTLVLGVMSLPRWQSFFALAVFVYAFYWFTHPIYIIP
jgi:hypothetical protein